MLIINARRLTGPPVAVRTAGDRIAETGADLVAKPGETVIDARGGTLIPGLWDHHIHLRATVAAAASIRVGPPQVRTPEEFRAVLAAATPQPDGWIRAVGYHNSVTGDLDRHTLDAVVPHVPLRIQHRSGAMWFVNSVGLAALGQADHPTGQLFRQDTQVAAATAGSATAFGPLSARLSAHGVIGVTEATPNLTAADLDSLDDAVGEGQIRQRVMVMSVDSGREHPNLGFGPVKRILDDDTLDLDGLSEWVAAVHHRGSAVAMHCVTVAQLVVATTALRTVGVHAGDRIEHAAVVPETMIGDLVELGVTVVTQPNFVAERGDEYLRDVPASEHEELWRLRTLQSAGVPVAGSTDAPFGDLDPWAAMRAARDRRTVSGSEISISEQISGAAAVNLFLGEPGDPGTPRELTAGSAADLCLLSASPEVVLRELDGELVSATVIGGELMKR
ncbi:amidohydrolase family protein [Williamsia sp.]|uniref:amidohydrolase family protein n=1 Tax=Williamsia sp. TaxID=1872085 RepID=UPI0039C9B275